METPVILAFWPREPGQWWGRFGHITVLTRSDDTWVAIDVRRKGVEIKTAWRHDDVQDLLSEITANCTVVKAQGSRSHFFAPMTCVSFAKHCTGIPSRALRPDRLLRDLLRNGAEVIHESRQAKRVQRANPEPTARRV